MAYPASDPYDLVVVGAGCAGATGAATAAGHGLRVAVLDASGHLGGEYLRHPATTPATGRTLATLRRHLDAGHVELLLGHHVWSVARGAGDLWDVHALTGADGDGGRPVRLRARALLLATGAGERHLPFPGWTLPGVVAAGGAQAMLKSGRVLPGRRIVVAGSGPLLLAVAAALATAGARIPAVVEAAGYPRYARRPGVLAANPRKLLEAVHHAAVLTQHQVRILSRSAVTEAHGTDRVEAVTVSRVDDAWRPVPGTERRIPCDAVAVGHGLLPSTTLADGLGCATRQLPRSATGLALDDDQTTSVAGVWAAGETGGVGGWRLARVEGELAGLAVAARLTGRPALTTTARARRLRRARRRMRAFADLMAEAHAPGRGWTDWLTGDTEVCRCEEVTAARVREAVADLGARDTRTVKLLTRAGMGWCQGHTCATAVACLAAGGDGTTTPSAGHRPLAVPVPLGVLADLDDRPAPPPRSTTPQ
ncbi:NAD(P)/FAD-dependent oxidoreductase [Streptantibioticus cattleyicolor]|uniref:Oxidase n=1 Tax=Streptantibioticus cattleyicolor (strain ATCC 35852 / DSM 46488 / JCM 4925 / NBRC 14057 / NRRL 8057) TaxID=1003195 RepID=F8JKN8_STREN|nr:NAD(P)/FAD-dependent oxidoreductase [Streptantibioticus cattleyicolor]AEW98472.1 oxidase [Streptantibioticus cattleyicolor NRRL 8057 = DSM 46488]CCB72472.1 Oxidase [Streptantibioticus cattleyicolor NRRL 8057 = DSM 46488]